MSETVTFPSMKNRRKITMNQMIINEKGSKMIKTENKLNGGDKKAGGSVRGPGVQIDWDRISEAELIALIAARLQFYNDFGEVDNGGEDGLEAGPMYSEDTEGVIDLLNEAVALLVMPTKESVIDVTEELTEDEEINGEGGEESSENDGGESQD